VKKLNFSLINDDANEQNRSTSYFSAKPSLMNFDMIHEVPLAPSLRRNGQGAENCQKEVVPDQDADGKYFGASLRRGPFMSV
jgi:hypothetical protein